MFQASFHTIVTLRASWYAPPDTGVPNLQLVSVEYLPSIEGALEIQMNVTFLRGKAPLPGADSPYQGEMSRRDKRGRDAVSRRLTERLSQICHETQTANSVCGLAFHSAVTLRVFYYAPPDTVHRICEQLPLNSCGKTSC